eukprot:scaffold632291_cov14-Prasinocladus_malaysianus.AAC.1
MKQTRRSTAETEQLILQHVLAARLYGEASLHASKAKQRQASKPDLLNVAIRSVLGWARQEK